MTEAKISYESPNPGSQEDLADLPSRHVRTNTRELRLLGLELAARGLDSAAIGKILGLPEREMGVLNRAGSNSTNTDEGAPDPGLEPEFIADMPPF
jgi:hypothetical protein